MIQTLSIIGLVIYFIILLVAVSIEKPNKNVEDYFFAGRSLPFWALSITFIASWWGAGSAISTADLAFEDGISAFWYYGVPVLISTFLMIIFSKSIRKVGYLTQGKLFSARYSKATAKYLSFLIYIFMTFSVASQMVGIGQFFGTYLNLNYEIGILIGTSIVLIYSVFGGFRGVVLTDIIQFIFLLVAALLVFIIATTNAGGFKQIYEYSKIINRPNYFSFFAGAKKYFAYVITFGCAWMIQANVWQRISATKDEKDAKKMTVMSFFIYIPLYLIVVLTGMAAIVLYDKMPEGGIIAAIVKDQMGHIMGAIVFVGISAAIMSTMDSLINTGALTLTLDLFNNGKESQDKIKISKYATIVTTLIALIISLRIRSILVISYLASDIITTGAFIPLIFGFFFKKGNSFGALSSMIVGSLYCFYNLFIELGLPFKPIFENDGTLRVVLGLTISLIVYLVGSLLTNDDTKKAEEFIEKAALLN
ncbi:MAG: sodium:solute symporter family protein [Sphaerochaetaceae bacterium]|nr:sodium:solute symporter family protein [Sphaerochaetaceae bacterium]